MPEVSMRCANCKRCVAYFGKSVCTADKCVWDIYVGVKI